MNKTRILLVDDHAVLRAGLRLLLDNQPDMEVIGEAGDPADGIAQAKADKPDIVLMDLSFPRGDGIAAIKTIRETQPEVKVIALTMHEDESYLRPVLQAGASGYVLKRAADTELISAIRAAVRGEVFIYPSLTRILLEDTLGKPKKPSPEEAVDMDLLSQREKEVLKLIARGHSNREVAEMLFLSVKTVDTYKARLMEKLGLESRVDLVKYALEHGLLER
ncbi:MAG: response regulator transcription factor [Chloroflexi bacterium]|nr:response regulator transcription factor [Chloroflexota bacterium]